jgi:hypothetical protein
MPSVLDKTEVTQEEKKSWQPKERVFAIVMSLGVSKRHLPCPVSVFVARTVDKGNRWAVFVCFVALSVLKDHGLLRPQKHATTKAGCCTGMLLGYR